MPLAHANRCLVLDTETTGLEAANGDRIVEIGAIELVDDQPTGVRFHTYLNPHSPSAPEALAVHGLTETFLSDQPDFRDIADSLLKFTRDATLIAHNAPFDIGFLNAELALAGPRYGRITDHSLVIDTRAIARARYPGEPHHLNDLCARFGIDTSARILHGAMIDAELLTKVWLALLADPTPAAALIPATRPASPRAAAPAP